MTTGLFLSRRRRPTLGALYVAAVGLFAVLLLALTVDGLADPIAIAIVAVPLGPIGIVAAALALPALSGPPSLALAGIFLAAVLAIAAINVLFAAAIAFAADGRIRLAR
jgi:hypothetical protein